MLLIYGYGEPKDLRSKSVHSGRTGEGQLREIIIEPGDESLRITLAEDKHIDLEGPKVTDD